MKMKKMIGAFALTAALAMGTAPAFAASATTPDPSTDAFSDNGSTEIKAKIDNINPAIRATVPLQVTVVFGGEGASDIIGPNPSAYKITNVGTGNIQVTEAEITANAAYSSVFGIDAIDTRDFSDAKGGDLSRFSSNVLSFFYTTTGNHTYLTPNHKLSQAVAGTPDSRYISNPKVFTPETLTPNQELEITLGGAAVFTSKVSQDDLTDTLCNIKYTIQAAA